MRLAYPLLMLAVGLALCPGLAAGARLGPAPAPSAALLMTAAGSSLLSVTTGGQVAAHPLPLALTATASAGATVVAFAGRRACEFTPAGELRPLGELPWPVHRAEGLADGGVVLLAGGKRSGAALRGAHVALWHPVSGDLRQAPHVRPEWDPYDLAVGPPPPVGQWQWVLLSVRKPAPFAPSVEARPFLFGYRRQPPDLHPLWKGTSLAHPFSALAVGPGGSGQAPQVLALEDLPGGRRQVATYHFSGLMQMEAASPALLLGRQLDVLALPGETLTVAFEHAVGAWRALALGPADSRRADGVRHLVVRLRTAALPAAPLAWTAVALPRPGVLALLASGQVRFLPLL